PARPPPGRPTPCSRRSPRPSATWRHACLFSVVGLSLEVRARFHFPSSDRDLMWHRPITGELRHFQVDTWQDSPRTPLILWRMALMGAVVVRTHPHEDPSPCAPYRLSAGSPMPPLASAGTVAPSPSRPRRPAVAASASTTMLRRSW